MARPQWGDTPLITYLPTNGQHLFLPKWLNEVKSDSNSLQVHLQLSHSRHPEDGALLVDTGLLKSWNGPRMEDLELVHILCVHDFCMRAWTGETMFGNVKRSALVFCKITSWLQRRSRQLSRICAPLR
jgi:hypothetical protein